jgi:hypothetical protein
VFVLGLLSGAWAGKFEIPCASNGKIETCEPEDGWLIKKVKYC